MVTESSITEQYQRNGDSPGKLHGLINSLTELATSSGHVFSRHAENLSELHERLDQGRIHIAVLGQFKRGKSSLLSALLGEEVLPTSVIPLTSIPTYIRFSHTRYIRVHFDNDKEDVVFTSDSPDEIRMFLSRYVSEEENPGNRLGVEGVELYFDSGLLRQGVVLIDTPGIGSTHLHNTEATLNFLPQCDAALFLVSADPPITEVEISFLNQVRKKIKKLFFIINKVDYLSESELNEVAAFITKVLSDKTGIAENIELFPLSSRYALNAAKLNDPVLKERSGILSLTHCLEKFMTSEKHDVLNTAIAGKTSDILHDIDMQVRLALKTYKIPVEELGEKLALFDEKIQEAERKKLISSDILTGERKRLLLLLEEQAEVLRKKARIHLETVLHEFVKRKEPLRENDVREAFSEAIPVFFERELGEMSMFFNKRVADIILQHHNRADEIIESVRLSASNIFNIPYHAHQGAAGIDFTHKPYWSLHHWKSTLVPLPDDLIDRLMPRGLRERRIRKRLERQIQILVLGNVENLRWSTLQNLDGTFRRFMIDLDKRFNDIIHVTREAISAAFEQRENYSEQIAAEITHLEGLIERLEKMHEIMRTIIESLEFLVKKEAV
ncbi:MAG TPA: dynamin family protein [Spirochaetota bacterium]|nr:dynamin family protein [Spirochaetota bacterium]